MAASILLPETAVDHAGLLACLDLFPEALLLLQPDGLVLLANQAARRRLQINGDTGWCLSGSAGSDDGSPGHITGQGNDSGSLHAYLRLCSRSKSLMPGRLVLGGVPYRGEGALLQPRRVDAPARVLLRLTPWEASVKRFVAINEQVDRLSREVDRRRRLEQQVAHYACELEEEHRRKDEFLAMLGHELRNPLAPIKTALTLLELAQGDEGKSRRAREVLQRQVSHMGHLVDDLLDVARIATGRIELKTQPLELGQVLAHALEQCEPLIRDKLQHLHFRSGGGLLHVNGDAHRLTQAVVNLLGNASRYTPQGGEIRLTVGRTAGNSGEAEIVVEDNGIGIDANVLPQIFDMFHRAARHPGPGEGGLGVGLTLVKRLVELHGGSVTASSEGAGKGARFCIRLPLTDAQPQPESAIVSGRPEQGHTVLVVDDNVDAAGMLSEVLQLLGHRAYTAHSGHSALALARDKQPEAVLLDIGLPGMDGYAVARALRKEAQGSRLLLVALTGYGQPEDRRKSQAAGFDYHLVKPVPIAEMARILTTLDQAPGTRA